MRRADEITLIEQIKLQVPGIGEVGDGAAFQRRDPVDAVQFGAPCPSRSRVKAPVLV